MDGPKRTGGLLRLAIRVAILLALGAIVATSIDVTTGFRVLAAPNRASPPLPTHVGPVPPVATTTVATTTTTPSPTTMPAPSVPLVAVDPNAPGSGTTQPPGPPGPPGPRPPQFIVISFDGARDHVAWQHWLSVAEQTNSHFTFFLSGVYLLDASTRDSYAPPGHAVGASDIGVSTPDEISVLETDLIRANGSGHEIGTHFNGHFCGPTGVNSWSTEDWTSEMNQFASFVDAADLPFPGTLPVGGRTPCLEGKMSQLHPAEVAAGFRYDASGVGGLVWPRRVDGLWDIPLQSIPLAGTNTTTLSMDYNFYYAQSKAGPAPPDQLTAMQEQVRASYAGAFDRMYNGNRAPMILGNHFAPWNGGIYRYALTDFLLESCVKPEVRCVPFVELVDWMDAQSPETLAAWQALPPA